VEVAVEVEIDFCGGLDLRKATSCCSAFHAKDGTERGFTRCDDRALADVRESLRQTDRGDGFALAGNGGRRCGDENHFAARFCERRIVQKFEANLCAVGTDLFDVLIGDFELFRDVLNREECFGHGE